MNKILTIIIPTYNMEKYLRKCLDSLIVSEENLQQLEVLVVNDGSKDSSSQIAHEYEAKYPQTFRVIDKENGNYGSCINRGLKEATGKYVKVLDADDYFVTSSFNDFIFFLNQYDADLIITKTQRVDNEGRIFKHDVFSIPTDRIITLDELPREIIHMHSMTYRMQILKDINYKQTEGMSYTDNEWSTWPLLHMKTAIYYPRTVYSYLVGREGQTVSDDSYVKNRLHFLHVSMGVMDKLSNMKPDQGRAFYYLQHRLKFILKFIYRKILIVDKCQHQQELIDFDKKMKSVYPQFYRMLDDVLLGRFVRYRFIHDWRNKSYPSHLDYRWLFLHYITSSVYSIIHSIK